MRNLATHSASYQFQISRPSSVKMNSTFESSEYSEFFSVLSGVGRSVSTQVVAVTRNKHNAKFEFVKTFNSYQDKD